MREIKFQYIYELLGTICRPTLTLKQIEEGLASADSFPSSAKIIAKRQFTGLQDKSGVDIYEGDIVKDVSNKHYWLSVIGIDNGKNGNANLYAMEFCNNVTYCEFENTYTYERQNSTRRNDINTSMKVIGNIYENPELRKGE